MRSCVRQDVVVGVSAGAIQAVALADVDGWAFPDETIRERLEPIISLRGLRLPLKSVYSRVFDLYCESGVSFVDAYSAAYMENRGIDEVYSYDTDFDLIPGISRVEPEG